ncbi:MAG: hypothetical protein LBM13_03025 [Candidatus Ancillula sp.]|jgi:aspartate carbamoyltransferase catalytic subunit|nr:hypothetical protein [Candidatus Ancillula sp.]
MSENIHHLLSIADLSPEQILKIMNTAQKIKKEQTGVDVEVPTSGQIFAGKHILIVGDISHSRVAMSNLQLITKLGGRVTFVAPPTLLATNMSLLPEVKIEYDFDKAISRADFDGIMLLRIQAERMLGGKMGPTGSKDAGYFPDLADYVSNYGLTNERVARIDPMVPILHPAPINRGLEISSEIADSPRSLINHQIANGVWTRMACLSLLVPGITNSKKTVVNLFYENSTRTRFSFEAAEKKLGMNIMNFSASGSSVAKGEGLKDTVSTLYAMGIDAIVIRHQHSGVAFRLANSNWIDVPVLNAGDGTHGHPTQALLDAMTLREYFSGFSRLHNTADRFGKQI